MISKVKSKYWKTTHKFGIRISKTIEDVMQIDYNTGTDFWKRVLSKEMSKIRVAWKTVNNYSTPQQVQEGKAATLIGYQEIKHHVIFDVKMDFTRDNS